MFLAVQRRRRASIVAVTSTDSVIRVRVRGSSAIDRAMYATVAKTRIGSRSRTRPRSANNARTRRVSLQRVGKRGVSRARTRRRVASARTAMPKTRTNANAASIHCRRAAGSAICCRAQPYSRGASTTTATPARISPVRTSMCCESWPKNVTAAGFSAAAPCCAAINARRSATSFARAESFCRVSTRRSRSSTVTGADAEPAGGGASARATAGRTVATQSSSRKAARYPNRRNPSPSPRR